LRFGRATETVRNLFPPTTFRPETRPYLGGSEKRRSEPKKRKQSAETYFLYDGYDRRLPLNGKRNERTDQQKTCFLNCKYYSITDFAMNALFKKMRMPICRSQQESYCNKTVFVSAQARPYFMKT
jgi:hypothetical protein